MAAYKTIKILINGDGTVEVDQIGWSGNQCHEDVQDLIKILGKETKTTKKQEYYKDQKVAVKQRW